MASTSRAPRAAPPSAGSTPLIAVAKASSSSAEPLMSDASAERDVATVEDAGVDASVEAATASYPGRADGCPDGMLRVEGEYCPVVVHTCLEHLPIASERCARYEKPSRCASPKTEHRTFCMDRFEYPNRTGELPMTLVDFHDARRLCADQEKRVCTVDEFNFACEGEELRPYATGWVREPSSCNIDRDVVITSTLRMPRHDACMKDPSCVAEMARFDRRYRIGERLGCVSWAGVYDLNGNVNEWARLPEQKQYPARGGLKGGWWGPIRARCRPTHTTHNEDYWGYELGFRCCKDAEGSPTDISGVSWRASQSTDR